MKKPSKKPTKTPAGHVGGGAKEPPRQEPTQEQIRERAYEIYLRRGGGEGRDWEDWTAAERELRGS